MYKILNGRDNLLKHILHAKFVQTANCKDYLLNTGDKKLAEASFRDTYDGIGITINDTNVLIKSRKMETCEKCAR